MRCADRYNYRRVTYLQGTRTVLCYVVLSATPLETSRRHGLSTDFADTPPSVLGDVNALESHPCALFRYKWLRITSLRKKGVGVGRRFPFWNSTAPGERFQIVRCGREARWAKIGPAILRG